MFTFNNAMIRQLSALLLFVLTILSSCDPSSNHQDQLKNLTPRHSTFYLSYALVGLGSNIGSMQPTIKVKGTQLLYTYEQNSYLGERTKKADTVLIQTFRTSSIDSIIDLVKDLGDTTIFNFNPLIMSGGIHLLTIAIDRDTIRYQLKNTFERTALKVMDIINSNLPSKEQLGATEQLIKDEEDAWAYIIKRHSKHNKHLRINK